MTEAKEFSLLFEEEKKKTLKAIQKKINSFTKAIKNAHDQLARSKDFEHVQHLAELVKANFPLLKRGMNEIKVADWKKEDAEVSIPLDPQANPKEQLEELFRKSQKLKRALSPLQALITKLDSDFHHWQTAFTQANDAKAIEELKRLQEDLNLFASISPKSKEEQKKQLPFHRFRTESGLEILVGKNASANDKLTFQVAHGTDLWLHAHGMSGSHVVIRKPKNRQVDSAALEDALQLALYYSKARSQPDGSHEVLLTERKHVSRLPRTPKGKVIVAKHKTYTIVLDKERIETIRHRK